MALSFLDVRKFTYPKIEFLATATEKSGGTTFNAGVRTHTAVPVLALGAEFDPQVISFAPHQCGRFGKRQLMPSEFTLLKGLKIHDISALPLAKSVVRKFVRKHLTHQKSIKKRAQRTAFSEAVICEKKLSISDSCDDR